MTAVRFEFRGDMYAVTFTYDAIVVEMLKAVVPSYARTWSPPRREWLIESVYSKPLSEALHRLGCTIVGLEPEPGDHTDWARALFQRVGPHRAGPVFRSLSRVLHPDTPTGDKQLQQELNAVHAELVAYTMKGHTQ